MSAALLVISAIAVVAVFLIGIFLGFSLRERQKASVDLPPPPAATTAPVTDEAPTKSSSAQEHGQLAVRGEERPPQAEDSDVLRDEIAALRQVVQVRAVAQEAKLDSLCEANSESQQQLSDLTSEVRDLLHRLGLIEAAARGNLPYSETANGDPEEANRLLAGPNGSRRGEDADHPRNEALLEGADSPQGAERRRAPRYPFYCKQWVAPYDGHRFPGPNQFHRVSCCDLSARGISFIFGEKPQFDTCIVRLRSPRGTKHLVAKVRRISQNRSTLHPWFTIGCEFVSVIHSDPSFAQPAPPALEASP